MADVQITITTVDNTSAAIQEIRKGFQNLEAGVEKLETSTKQLNPAVAKTAQELDKTTAAAKKSAGGIQSLIKSYTDISFVVRDFARIAEGAWNFAKSGAQIELQQGRFERLAVSIGTTSEALSQELTVAMRGMMSEADSMAMATDFMSLGLAKTSDQVVRLAAVSSGLNMDMNQLVLTLANKTTMRFDQLGVAVDGFDERLAALRATGMSVDDAFTEAFLQQGEAQIEKVGNAADTSAGQLAIFEAQIEDLTNSLKVQAAQAIAPSITSFNQLSVIMEKVHKNYTNSIVDTENWIPLMRTSADMAGLLWYGIDQLDGELGNLPFSIDAATMAQREMNDAVGRGAAILPPITEMTGEFARIMVDEAEPAARIMRDSLNGAAGGAETLAGTFVTAQTASENLQAQMEGFPKEFKVDSTVTAYKKGSDEAWAVINYQMGQYNTQTGYGGYAQGEFTGEHPTDEGEQFGSYGGGFASGGFAKGRFVVGDAPGGGWTPYTEIVDAPQGAKVYSNAASRRMRGSMPGYAGGTDGNMEAMFDRLANRIIVGVRDAVQQVA